MRTMIASVLLFMIATWVTAQDKGVVAELQQLDTTVFKKDSSESKLRFESLKKLRETVNKRDVDAWRAVKTKADWETLRDERIAKLRASMGNFPDAPKEVKVVTTKKIPGDGCTIECILYESRPNFFVTANLYVPDNTSKPMPGFIVIHSHHNPKTQGELQDMGMIWARQGCLVLIPDMLGHGERRQHPFVDAKSYPEKFAVSRQDYHFRYNVNLQLSLVGESLMGFMVWDLMRGVDVLYQRPNIDKSKIMVFGSVAGGGDPCAVFAALDKRVTAAAPFNFGGPQPETKLPLPEDADLAFNYMGGGGWESTRGLKLGARDGFHAWVIVGSLAPRGLIYSHEFAWDDKRDPVWTRFNKIWGDFYGAADKLGSAKGSGSVKGTPSESTHCNNIGAIHRKPMYPTLNRWFGLPIPEENKKRFDSSELRCWTDDAKKALKSRMVHDLAHDIIKTSKDVAVLDQRLPEALGLPNVGEKVNVEVVEKRKENGFQLDKLIVRGDVSVVPMVILRPIGVKASQVVIGLAQEGKAGFLKHRAETIAELLKKGVAVCLPDLCGTGETASDGRGRTSGATSYSATLLLHGQTVPGVQLKELIAVIDALRLPRMDYAYKEIALWGDSFTEPNDPKMNLVAPYDNNVKLPRQSEPMGGLLALLGGIYVENVKAIYVRGGLVSFTSMLDSPFCYFPHDAVIPGVLRITDLDTLAAANAKSGLRMEALVDGLNRRVDQKTLVNAYKGAMFTRPAHDLMVLRAEASTPGEVAAWLVAKFKK